MQAVGPWEGEPATGITPLVYTPVPYEEMRLNEEKKSGRGVGGPQDVPEDLRLRKS